MNLMGGNLGTKERKKGHLLEKEFPFFNPDE